MSKKGLLKFITCGSVDDGKSTLIGHILYDSKLLYADQEQALILDSKVGSRGGDIDYSLLLDGLMAEREQGITIDVAYRYFTTNERSFIVADTPGHEEYTRNMAVGASFADLAVILVDASKGVLSQTRRHARICALMGIRRFVFAVNKIDLVGYKEEVFNKVAEDIRSLCAELAVYNMDIIPLSATEGDNVTKTSPNLPWYKGTVLLSCLENAGIDTEGEVGFYMPVQRVCRPDRTFRGFQGQIESGALKAGDEITALPSGETAVVKSVYAADKKTDAARVGMPVTIQLDREVDVSRGCVLTKDAGLRTAKSFYTEILWMDDKALTIGTEYWVKIGAKLLPAVVTAILHKIDVNSGEEIQTDSLRKNELARCEVVLSEDAVVSVFDTHRTLGELILIDRVSHATSACGVIKEINENADGVVFEAEGRLIPLGLFDKFYYHRELHTVIRHTAKSAVYKTGGKLPLVSDGYAYPADFDIAAENLILRVRDGSFEGSGKRGDVPLLDARGFGVSFQEYHKVAVWEE
ncbi:hypothetical protein AGMMS49975_12200 [Clostridia bacterium]|nr:hypothetical protein AGMMS49975_12200 [Clostridia bacterium]